MEKSAYLQQLDAYDTTVRDNARQELAQLLVAFSEQPPLDYPPYATISDENGKLAGVWDLSYRFSDEDSIFISPMILIDDRGGLYKTRRHFRSRRGKFISRRLRGLLLLPNDLTSDEIRGILPRLKDLVKRELLRKELEASQQP